MKIGFIGLGNVGGKLAGTLLRNCLLYTSDAADDPLHFGHVGRRAINKKLKAPAYHNKTNTSDIILITE